AKVRTVGLLGALSGGGRSNAIAAALNIPRIDNILSGMSPDVSVTGQGSSGIGLLGIAPRASQQGNSLLSAGRIDTAPAHAALEAVPTKARRRSEVRVSVKEGQPKVSGFLSAEQINRIVRANQAALRYCYELEVQLQPELQGQVELTWQIDLSGQVSTVRVTRSSLHNARVEGCLSRQVKRCPFPTPSCAAVPSAY